LHDIEGVNRLLDGASQELGGLTITNVRLEAKILI
jgi:hypothetical protein